MPVAGRSRAALTRRSHRVHCGHVGREAARDEVGQGGGLGATTGLQLASLEPTAHAALLACGLWPPLGGEDMWSSSRQAEVATAMEFLKKLNPENDLTNITGRRFEGIFYF